jgi:hypothetical protein
MGRSASIVKEANAHGLKAKSLFTITPGSTHLFVAQLKHLPCALLLWLSTVLSH